MGDQKDKKDKVNYQSCKGESRLELARQQWLAGLYGRVQAIETLMSGPERTEAPTPKMDDDD